MNRTVLFFEPTAGANTKRNLSAFVAQCRRTEVLDAKTQFSLDTWEIGRLKGQNKILRIRFSTLKTARAKRFTPLSPPFLNFAKAILVYLESSRKVVSPAVRLAALRFLEAALNEHTNGSNPNDVDVTILEHAAKLASEHLSPAAAFRTMGQLEAISKVMVDKGFVTSYVDWKNPLRRPNELGSQISEEAMQAREEKLPTVAVVRAIAGMFWQAASPVDVLVSSHLALQLCAPERINENLRLKVGCIHREDGRFKGKTGIRWPGSKGMEDHIRWLPSTMVETAVEAVKRLTNASAHGRALAYWYSQNPKKLFFHEGALHLKRSKLLRPKEIALLLWGEEDANARVAANLWARDTHSLEPVKQKGRNIAYHLKDVERAILSMLPSTFPFVPGAPNLRCADSLAISRLNEMHSKRATYLCMFAVADYNTLTNPLGARKGRSSIFTKFKFTEDDGSSIELNTYQLRHYMNMIAQVGGLNELEVAAFSGRKDVGQNIAYDHRTSEEILAPVAHSVNTGFTASLIPPSTRQIFRRSEFKNVGLAVGHTTEFGWCSHSYATEPCQMYRDCINCEEHVCVKGEVEKEAHLKRQKEETETLLAIAREALTKEQYGADLWVKHHLETLKRIDELLALLNSPAIKEGAHIKLNITNPLPIYDARARARALGKRS